jgi:hypothetical protein
MRGNCKADTQTMQMSELQESALAADETHGA